MPDKAILEVKYKAFSHGGIFRIMIEATHCILYLAKKEN
jgi:hypothetical protein